MKTLEEYKQILSEKVEELLKAWPEAPINSKETVINSLAKMLIEDKYTVTVKDKKDNSYKLFSAVGYIDGDYLMSTAESGSKPYSSSTCLLVDDKENIVSIFVKESADCSSLLIF